MDTIADYDAWKSKQQQSTVASAGIVLETINVKPDEMAGDMQLAHEYAKSTGKPVPPLSMVAENRSIFQQQIERKKNATLLSSSPMLAEWLRKPDNAALARDDLENLTWFEGFGRGAAGAGKRAAERIGQAGNQFMLEQTAGRASDRSKSFGGLLESERDTISTSSGDQKAWVNLSDLISASGRYIDARYADLIGADDATAAGQFAENLKASRDALAAIPKSQIATAFEKEAMVDGAGLGDAVANFGRAFASNPLGGLSWALEAAGESAPQIGAALVATIATRNPAVGVGVLGGGSYATERFTSPAEFLGEKGIDLGKPEDVQRLIADPTLMKDAADRGVIRGSIIGAFDMFSGGIAGRTLAGNPFVEALAQGVTQMIFGSSGEYAARLASGQEIDWNEILAEGFAELATTPVDMGIAGRKFTSDRRAAKQAEARETEIKELAGGAASSVLRGRIPDTFRDFVARATANGPVENMYVPADQFIEYFQGAGVDPFALADELEGVNSDDLRTALATGGDVQIPTATYAAKMAGSDHDAFLIENARFSPDEMTAREAREFNERAEDAMQEAFEEAERMRQDDEQYRSFEAQIYDDMVSRLRAAGRSTDVATSEAMLYPAFYRVMAERSGLTTEEFLARYPLPQVRGDVPQGLQMKNVDALTRTLAEARAQKSVGVDRRQSLLEFIADYGGISDRGGELRARDAEVIDRGRGKKKIRLARKSLTDGMKSLFGADGGKKHGPDDVALAAIEAGFMADHPAVMAYKEALATGGQVPDIGAALWEAIDAELGGLQNFSVDQAKPAEPDADADQIEQYLSSLGVSLDDADDAIRAAIEADQSEEVRRYGQSGDVRGNRGSVQFPLAGVGNGDSVISLFRTADLSTFIHESGHYFLTVMQDLAARGELASGADYSAVKNWWLSNAGDVAKDAMRVMPDVKIAPEDVIAALENGSTGDLMKDAAVDVGLQEQWARAFEAYLLEGKAPSIELRGAFEKFRAWLLSIYKKLAGLNVTPSDDLRAVFDRMLATDEQIATARQQSADSDPVFATAEEMGLSPEDYAAFLKLRDQSIDEAHAKLLAETMAPIKREREKWYREERAKVRDEVELDVSSQRVYRAIEWMGNRRWFGDAAPEPMGDIRLSKDILVDRYGAGVLKTLPRGKQTVYAVEGGLDPDDAAGVFGFGSGDEMIKALEQAPPRKHAIEDQTDRVMFERHGDVLRDGTVEAAALAAVHGDKRAQALALELKALVEVSGSDRGLTHKEAREIARQTLSRAKVRDAVNANRYLAAERKAGEEAERLASSVTRTGMWMAAARRRVAVKARAAVRSENAAGVAAVPPQIDRANDTTGRYNENVAKLVEAKRRQLLNHALYSEARRVAEEVEVAEKLVSKLEKATKKIRSGRKRMGEASLAGDYVEAIEAIIYGYEFRKVSGAKVDRRAGLLAYIERMTADGRANELAIPQAVLDDARVVNYRSLPVEHLRGVVDSLKNIEHTARMKGQMLINKRKREFEEATADVARAISENVKDRPIHWVKDDRATAKAREFVSGYISTLQSSTTILRQLDGREDMGVVYETLKSDMDAAAYAERDMRKEATEKILDLYSVYSEDEQRRMAVRMVIPELGGQSFSKWNLIAMALNMGNEGNLARLTNKNALMHLTPDQVDAVKGLLDTRDAKFVQSVWDYINSFRPKIAERDRRIRGVEPTWVDPAPIEIAGLTLRGGYYPIKYEGRLGGALFSSGDSDADILNSMMSSGFSSAQTKNGHLKARGEHIKQSLALDVSVIAQHANEVIHDLTFAEPVVNTWRILTNGKVEQAMIGAGLDAQYKMLKLWVQDAASGQVSSGSGLARSVQFVRSGFTYSKLALNLKTILLQPLGLMQSAVVVGKKNLAYQTMRYAQNPVAMTNDVLARSRMMWERRQTFNKDLMDAVAQSNIANPTAGKIRTAMDDYIIPFGMAGITYTQFYVVDVPTWAAAFQKGMKQFKGDEVKAAQFADMTVQRSQGSGIWSDRPGIERGTLSQTMRQNPFVTLLTTLGSYFFAKMNLIVERTQGLRAEPVSVGAAMSYALDMSLLLAGEAAVLALVKEAFDDDDGDDDDNIAATIAMEAAKTFVAGLPVVRDVAGLSQGFQAGTYASILDTVWAPLKQAGQGEVDKALVKSVVNLTGMLTRLPSSQTNRIIDGAWRELDGEDVSVIEYLMGRSKK